MKNHPHHPHTTALLVNIADSHALVDGAGERLFILNDAAAAVWRDLAVGVTPRNPASQAFAAELAALGLVAGQAMPEPTEADGDNVPRILAQAPLQVAANTSDPNPFSADASW